ncbi:MAG: biosynthetic-type acetolactate synthase large subunit [Candidatus Gastranaerophilales bacterium]|nr:biosynthetic-type acetolactate synthase large subunit [Candidatus Gastranaerophilales bacterium]
MTEKTLSSQKAETRIITGAQIFMEALRKEGVKEIFGYPGGVILSIYEQLYHHNDIKHFLVRHEQAAIHAAEGYARVTGKPGVALVTSGPGACNTVTGIANAYYDGYPIVVFTGQVDSKLIGNDAFQEADIIGITSPCCKHNFLVKNVKDLPRIIKEAFHIASTGKPGPVVVDMPRDVLVGKAEFNYPEKVNLPGYNPTYAGHPLQIHKALKYLYKAKTPVIITGGGIIASNASEELTKLAGSLRVPVVNTLMGTGTFPGKDELSLGMMGMHGNYCANMAIAHCDVLLALGTRFSDRVTGKLEKFCPDAKIIHVDIDPCSISKNVPVDIPIVGDLKNVLIDMLNDIDLNEAEKSFEKREVWLNQLKKWKEVKPKWNIQDGKLIPPTVIEGIFESLKGKDAIVTTEVGQHQMWAANLCKFNEPRRFVTSGGLGTMGFGFPAAMGAQIAFPERLVIDISGDGSFQMNIQELATCVNYKVPVKICIINNGHLGMIRQLQEVLFDKNYSQCLITGPDFVKLAEAYGAAGIRVTKEEDIIPAMQKAFDIDGPVIIDFIVQPEELVYPWVLSGDPLNKILLNNPGGV